MEVFQPTGDQPLYKQVYDWIKNNIETDDWVPGTQIPPEPTLSRDLGVSRQTLRQALQILINEGFLFRVQGKGTFVKNSRAQYELGTLSSFTEQMIALGKRPSSRVISFQANLQPDRELQLSLVLSTVDRVVKIERLRLADDVPMSLETVFINEKLCPGLEKSNVENQSIYDLVENHYAIPISHGDISIEASQATAEEAEILQVEPFSPILDMKCLNYTRNSRPLFITYARYPKARYIFTVSVPRHV